MTQPLTAPAATHSISAARVRQPVVVEGRIERVEVVSWAGGPVVEAVLRDRERGEDLVLVFMGRRVVGGIEADRRLTAAGVVAPHRGRRVLLNPQFWLQPSPNGHTHASALDTPHHLLEVV